MRKDAKFGKSLSIYGLGETIPMLPYGKTNLGNAVFNTSNNLIAMAYSNLWGETLRFGSASKDITRRYLSQKLMDISFGQIGKKRRKKQKEILEKLIADLGARGKAYREIMESTSDLLTDDNAINKLTKEKLVSYLKLSKPKADGEKNTVKGSDSDKGYNNNGLKTRDSKNIPDFIDGSAIMNTSSKKNVVLTTVTGRDTTRKEYISGGDVNINVSGSISSNFPDVFPVEELNQFIYYMEYGGVLEAEHLALLPHGIKHILILDYKIDYKQGFMNTADYSFSAVGVAHSKDVLLEYKLSEDIRNATENTNMWLQSKMNESKDKNEIDTKNIQSDKFKRIKAIQSKMIKKSENLKVFNFIEKWL